MESTENNNYASKGVGTTGLTLASVAAFLAASNSGLFGNILGGNNRPAPEPPATQRDLGYERQLTEKDTEIGQLKAQQYTDKGIIDLERRMEDKFDKIEAQIAAQNQAQAVLNAHQSDAIALAQGEIARMKSVFNIYISQPTMAASEAALTMFKSQAVPAGTNQAAG